MCQCHFTWAGLIIEFKNGSEIGFAVIMEEKVVHSLVWICTESSQNIPFFMKLLCTWLKRNPSRSWRLKLVKNYRGIVPERLTLNVIGRNGS